MPRSLSSSFARSTRRLSRRRLGALALDDPRSAEHDTACGPRVHALLRSGRRADLGSGRGGVARGRGRYSPSRTQQPAARPLGGLRPALAGARARLPCLDPARSVRPHHVQLEVQAQAARVEPAASRRRRPPSATAPRSAAASSSWSARGSPNRGRSTLAQVNARPLPVKLCDGVARLFAPYL